MTTAPNSVGPQKGPLVTNIISVERHPISKGVYIMTKTAEKTAAKAQETATKASTGIKDRAAEAFEKSKDFASKGYEFQKGNIEATIEAGKIAVKGAQEMGKTNVEFAKSNFGELQAAAKEITTVKSPTDLVKLQGDLTKKSFETAAKQASQNTEAAVKLFSDMFQPISDRIAVATDMVKKAA